MIDNPAMTIATTSAQVAPGDHGKSDDRDKNAEREMDPAPRRDTPAVGIFHADDDDVVLRQRRNALHNLENANSDEKKPGNDRGTRGQNPALRSNPRSRRFTSAYSGHGSSSMRIAA
jgi:hypothetical protein